MIGVLKVLKKVDDIKATQMKEVAKNAKDAVVEKVEQVKDAVVEAFVEKVKSVFNPERNIIPSRGLKYKQPYNIMEIGEDSMKLINISNGKLEKLGAYSLSFSTSEGLSPGIFKKLKNTEKFIVDMCKV